MIVVLLHFLLSSIFWRLPYLRILLTFSSALGIRPMLRQNRAAQLHPFSGHFKICMKSMNESVLLHHYTALYLGYEASAAAESVL